MKNKVKEEFLNQLRGMASLTIETTPRFIVTKKFYEKLLTVYSPKVAAVISGSLIVDADESLTEDEKYLEEVVDIYFILVVKIKKAMDAVNPDLFFQMLKGSDSPLKIKFKNEV